MDTQPFIVQVPEAELTDLRTRLARTRWPDEIAGAESYAPYLGPGARGLSAAEQAFQQERER